MIERVIELLKANKAISGWKLNSEHTESVELFFIKKVLDMNRGKKVSRLTLTVYVDFEENGKAFRGSSSARLHPTLSDDEIAGTIERLSFAAKLVKNPVYPLAVLSSIKPAETSSNLGEKPLEQWIPGFYKAIYENDIYDKGGVNSAELFLNRTSTRVVNSEGVDISYCGCSGTLEFITTWKETGEEIELYRNLDFSNFDPGYISSEVAHMIRECKNKASAKLTPAVTSMPVLLTGTPVKEFFSYYYNQADANAVYNKLSTLKPGDNVQGKALGDRVSIVLDPAMEGSIYSAPFDGDGFPLVKVDLYADGVLRQNWGNLRFSHYLNTPPTGNISNFQVKGGSKSEVELRQSSYLELLAFSDFQMDSLTGDFAGEIRLGYYCDGKNRIPVTGGSLSGNIKKVHQNMFLSSELQQDNNFIGPKTILLNGASIAGAE
ncbi:MAG: metallopeptidase TldD-related protein [Bacillota bacterium]|nr:metallopeptidase TldD-related protein [Bacillota bacterium]